MSNVLGYTLLMAAITFAIGFFVALIIKVVFNSIQRMMRVQTVEYKAGMQRVRQINSIRKQNHLSSLESVRDNGNHQRKNRILSGNDVNRIDTNEIIEYYYGKS